MAIFERHNDFPQDPTALLEQTEQRSENKSGKKINSAT
jgi:hypothetical protein